MSISIQTTLRNLPTSEALLDCVQQEADKLTRYFDGITSCKVMVEAPNRNHHHGMPFQVRIALTVPGKELVVAHEPPVRAALKKRGLETAGHKADETEVPHKDAYLAVRDGFAVMRRQLQDYVRCLRRE